jgi:hypothetical protein
MQEELKKPATAGDEISRGHFTRHQHSAVPAADHLPMKPPQVGLQPRPAASSTPATSGQVNTDNAINLWMQPQSGWHITGNIMSSFQT